MLKTQAERLQTCNVKTIDNFKIMYYINIVNKI
jgi:hypothetical protein